MISGYFVSKQVLTNKLVDDTAGITEYNYIENVDEAYSLYSDMVKAAQVDYEDYKDHDTYMLIMLCKYNKFESNDIEHVMVMDILASSVVSWYNHADFVCTRK